MKIEKLYPECKDNIWGGVKLKEKYGKVTEKDPCAESWELSFHKDGPTRLVSGKQLSEVASTEDLGTNIKGFPFFPVLAKFIDAKEDLSVQVHPSDEYALEKENSFGKTEMWYIVEAEKGAGIYLGFSRDVTKEEYERAIAEGRLTELLNFFEVKAGECYFIPSGTIHAIGKGCLICEIQQNSNLTYRVYDYMRRDKNGNLRELHVEKALKVTNLKRYERKSLIGGVLGASKYFTVKKLNLNGREERFADKKSFCCLICVRGEGKLDGEAVKTGDSFFVPAGYGKFVLEGDMEMIETEVRKYYVGIDLGGTFIKGGIVSDKGDLIAEAKVPTESAEGAGRVAMNVKKLCDLLLAEADMTADDIVGIGMGVPGMIDSERGEVVYSNNLGWEHFMIGEEVERLTGLPVKIANDANVAALGESKFGCGRDYQTTVLLTLGTGVGGGIVLNGKLYEGNRSAGAELGHSVIVACGEQCTCGRRGCLEAYASATALIRDTRRAMMDANRKSPMWEVGTLDDVTGKTAFDYADRCPAAKAVVENYIEKLGVGITNIANVFRPEAVMLGGGVCAQGEALVKPLQEQLDKEIFAGDKGPKVKILTAELGNKAGTLGAAALWLD
ncbi:MAG: ROK family protein [Clostridia bacterium]|nr:ROK family protein [Clostridia bacterium]